MSAATEIALSQQKGARGFTLLEAIVALTIIGIALIPVMSFLAQATRQIAAAADSNARVQAQQTVMAYVDVLNPLPHPSGEVALSPHLGLRWTSTPLADANSQTRLGGRLGTYRLGFYAVDVTVLRDGKDWFDFRARKIGYAPLNIEIVPGLTK